VRKELKQETEKRSVSLIGWKGVGGSLPRDQKKGIADAKSRESLPIRKKRGKRQLKNKYCAAENFSANFQKKIADAIKSVCVQGRDPWGGLGQGNPNYKRGEGKKKK